MAVKFTNNARTTLAADISNSATTATVTSGSVFPVLNAGEYFYCTFDNGTNNEIVKVTARSGNTLTIVRGVDNTTARAFSTDDAAELRATAGLLTDIQENIAAKSANQTVYNATTASSATDYDIGIDPGLESNAMVFLNGVMQHHDTFSFSGSTLTFDTAPSNGLALEVIVDNLINLQSSNLTVDTFTAADVGGNPQVDFVLSDAPAGETNLIVFVDGVFQANDTYTISSTTLSMTDGVTADMTVTVYVMNPVNIGAPSDNTVTSSKLSGNITMPADLTVTGDVAFDSPTFVVDNANSRVGIGTASPSTLLDIVGDVKMSANLTVDTDTLHVDATNNRVGIGTTNPQGTFVVSNSGAGGFEFTPDTTSFSVANSNYIASYDRSASAYRDIVVDLGGAESQAVRFKAGGSVGIGTSAPLAKLDVRMSDSNGDYGRGRDGNLNLENTNTSVTEGGWLSISGYMGNSASNGQYQMGYISGGKQTTAADGDYGGYLTFWTTSSGANGEANSGGYERMRIDSSGQLLLGTTTSDSLLSVDIQNTSASSNNTLVRIKNTIGSEDAGLIIDGNNSGQNEYRIGVNTVADTSDLTFSGGTGYRFYTGSTEAMRISSNGQVLLTAAHPSIQFTDSSDNSDAYIQADGGTLRFFADDNNEVGSSFQSFHVDGSEKMRIDQSGSLLVGKTEDGGSNPGHVFFGAGAAYHIRDGGFTNYFNRKSSDGEILRFAKDGSTVGSIGASVGDLTIYSSSNNHCGLRFTSGGLAPVDDDGALVADTVDIGQSSWKFKDLHLSGGAYVYEVQTQTLGLGSTVAGASVGTNYSEPKGVFWHNGGGMTDYAIYRTPGAWSGNYQQLKLDWDTGIIIDGGTAYGKSGVHIHGNISMGDSTYSNFTSPNYPVHICADNYGLMIESATGYGHLGSNNTSYFHFGGNRNFYFDNRCEASGGFHTYSDENLKKEITVIPSALNKVAKMNGVTFKWKDAAKRGGGDAGKQFGVTAQNMLEVDSELPTKNIDPLYNVEDGVSADDEYYTMDYNRITPFLIEAVKELKTKLEAAEARIATLESE